MIATLKNETTGQEMVGVDVDVFIAAVEDSGDPHVNAWRIVPGSEVDGHASEPVAIVEETAETQVPEDTPETDEQAAARIAAAGPTDADKAAMAAALAGAPMAAVTSELQSLSTADIGGLESLQLGGL